MKLTKVTARSDGCDNLIRGTIITAGMGHKEGTKNRRKEKKANQRKQNNIVLDITPIQHRARYYNVRNYMSRSICKNMSISINLSFLLVQTSSSSTIKSKSDDTY